MKIHQYFEKHSVDDFAVAEVSNFDAPEGFHPNDILPSCNRLIVFGKIIPKYVFESQSKVKSFYLYRLINQMDNISFELCDILRCEGYKAISIPTFFPIKIHDGKLKGYLSLKHCAVGAGMGSIGLNTLLISEKYGNRLCLSALLTEKEIDFPIKNIHKNLCFNCNKCRDICPTNAINKNGVKVAKCINFTYSIPKLARPVVHHMMGLRLTEKYLEIFVNIMGWNSEMVCSECLTVCPHYQTYNDMII